MLTRYFTPSPIQLGARFWIACEPADSGTVAANFPLSWPAISRHLRVLRDVRLAVDVRVGRRRIYAVDTLPLRSVAGWLQCYLS
jgi:DNA-binding transcriptional ArsR family regulator